ncbi:MAG: hypothetical protein K0U41_09920 [Gammaproteobacteria bacterium]|nr:hypothetical protein [Gammaproteobacteria bacterium]
MAQFELTTVAQLTIYSTNTGNPGPGSTNNRATPPRPYTETEVKQAIYRAIEYIMNNFYNKFSSNFQADTLELLPELVKTRLMKAADIAASLELGSPKIFTVVHAPGSGQELKKSGENEFFQSRVAGDVTNVIQSTQTVATELHSLLDEFVDGATSSTGTAASGFDAFVLVNRGSNGRCR